MYCMNDHANHVARRAYEKGWISRARVKKIFHRGLEEAFEGFRDGCLATSLPEQYDKLWKILQIYVETLET